MRPFSTIAAVILAVIALVHLLRVVYGWQVVFNGWAVPMWLSWVGVIVAGALSALVWREARR